MLTYSPGPWRLIRSGQGCVFVPSAVDAEATTRIWRAMREGGDAFAAVLGTLIERARGDMAALPEFVVVSHDTDAVRVVVRGGARVSVTHSSGKPETVSASGAPTWTDRVFVAPRVVSVSVDEAGGDAFPIADGVVSAASAEWALTSEATRAPVVTDRAVVASATPGATLDAFEPVSAPSHETAIAPGEDTFSLVEADSEPVTASAEAGDETTAYDDLIFGETRMSSVEDAAVRNDVEPELRGEPHTY